MSKLVPQTDYQETSELVPRYRYARLGMNNTNSLVYTPTSSTLCEFKVPSATVFNLAKSFIGIQLPYPAGAAGNWTVVYDKGVTAFRSVFFGPAGGLPLCDIPFSDVYTECMLPMRTKRSELDCNPMQALYRCNQLNTSNLIPASRDGLLTGTQNASSSSYTENQYLRYSSTPATALTVNKLYPLSSFVDTVFDQDQDLIFGTDMYLRLQTAPLQRMVFYTSSPANPNVAANLTSINANVTAANVFLYLAIEENITIKNSLISSLASGGLKMAIPNTVVNRVSLPANQVSNNVTLSLNKSAGGILKRIVNAFYNGTEFASSLAYDHSCVNGTKISSFQSAINSRPLQDYIQIPFNPDCNNTVTGQVAPSILADDWRENGKYLTGSCVGSFSEYQTNWFWQDSWGTPAFIDDQDHRISKNLDGYNLLDQGDVIYTLALQSSAAADANYNNRDGLILYQFVSLIRHLNIMPSGVSISV